MDLPSWLDDAFLTTVLQNDETCATPVIIKEWSAQAAVAEGNNYTSKVYRVLVKHSSDKSTALIVKAAIEKGVFKDLSDYLYITETLVYRELMPLMFRKTQTHLAPKGFFSPVKHGVVLKDLNEEGYVMRDRNKGLDLKHCKIVVENLAKFHAASVTIAKEAPDLIESIGKEKLFNKGPISEMAKPLAEFSVKQILKMLDDDKSLELLSKYIRSKIGNVWEGACDAVEPRKDSLNVLNHGDCWIANMLFKYDDLENIEDLKLIDFQLPRYGTPALDLLHVLWTSATEEVRDNNQQQLFDLYLSNLNQNLNNLGCEETLSSDELRRMLRASTDYILILISYVLPIIMNDQDDALNFENFEGITHGENNEQWSSALCGDRYKVMLPVLLRQFNSWLQDTQ